MRIAQSGHGWVLGFVELSLGDANAALPYLRRSYELRNAFMLEPGRRVELGDLLEALIAVGELDEADEILATWQERAEALDRAWALAILARCRGAAARGARRARRRLRELRARARRACAEQGSVPARAHAARPRPNAAAREAARRSAHDPGGRARRFEQAGRAALGRADARRARAHRRARTLARAS